MFLGGTKNNHENFSQDCLSSCRNLKSGCPEYEPKSLTAETLCVILNDLNISIQNAELQLPLL